jgi:sRNA-binding carbon storage regulator CsrA
MVVRVVGNRVVIGIEAPKEVRIVRKELGNKYAPPKS